MFLKPHGVARAEFQILSGLPQELRVGIFADSPEWFCEKNLIGAKRRWTTPGWQVSSTGNWRVYKPRDKAKVENAVGIVERWILAALRHRKFFLVADLNEAIEELLECLKPTC